MSTIESVLQKHRPNLTAGSLRTYKSIIKNLYTRIHGDDAKARVKTEEYVDFYCNQYERVLEYLKNVPFSKRKTLLAALVVFCGPEAKSAEEYREQMIKDADQYNSEQRKQRKSQKEEDNWVSQDYVMEKLKFLEKHHRKQLTSKDELSMFELQSLMNLIVLSLYTLIPPRRLLDYTSFKLRDIDKDIDNYMEGNKFVFNNYKTKSKYGQQVVKIPQKLRILIQRWASKHPYEYLLFNEKGEPIPPPRLTMKLNRIFDGRRISVNMLRHIFISDKVLENVPALEKLDQVAKDMGHSVDQQALYKKVVAKE